MFACLQTERPSNEVTAEAVEVYASAFAQRPYLEGPEQAANFRDRIERYASERDGFRMATVRGDDGRLNAIGLAVLARPGHWWRDHVASVLDKAAVDCWIGAQCLEVVHLAVRPSVQRNGLGKVAHDLLLAGSPAPTAILSCHPQYPAPRQLYLSRGWQEIGLLPVPEGEPFLVMGRRL